MRLHLFMILSKTRTIIIYTVAALTFVIFLLCGALTLKPSLQHTAAIKFGPKFSTLFVPIILTIIAAIFATIAFVVDVVVVSIVRTRVGDAALHTKNFTADVGSIVRGIKYTILSSSNWYCSQPIIVCIATLILWIIVIILFIYDIR